MRYEIEVTALHLKLVVSAQKIKVPKCHNLPYTYIHTFKVIEDIAAIDSNYY